MQRVKVLKDGYLYCLNLSCIHSYSPCVVLISYHIVNLLRAALFVFRLKSVPFDVLFYFF